MMTNESLGNDDIGTLIVKKRVASNNSFIKDLAHAVLGYALSLDEIHELEYDVKVWHFP
jgi:hypothetical protein